MTAVVRGSFGSESSRAAYTEIYGKAATLVRHSAHLRECDSCDALWRNEQHVALGIKVADCLPVAMIDPIHDVMANIHSGWRGAVQRITAATIDEIEQSSLFEPAEAFPFLGPSILACCFDVGQEVASHFHSPYVN